MTNSEDNADLAARLEAIEGWLSTRMKDKAFRDAFAKEATTEAADLTALLTKISDALGAEELTEENILKRIRSLRAAALPEHLVKKVRQQCLTWPNSQTASMHILHEIKAWLDYSTVSGLHPDESAFELFAEACVDKLAQARAKGRSGWRAAPFSELADGLIEHLEKGDVRDIANYCMFLWHGNSDSGTAVRDALIRYVSLYGNRQYQAGLLMAAEYLNGRPTRAVVYAPGTGIDTACVERWSTVVELRKRAGCDANGKPLPDSSDKSEEGEHA